MTDHCRKSYWSRALIVAVCYAVALQAFLAAFGAALAISHGCGAADGFNTICHSSRSPYLRTYMSTLCKGINRVNLLTCALTALT